MVNSFIAKLNPLQVIYILSCFFFTVTHQIYPFALSRETSPLKEFCFNRTTSGRDVLHMTQHSCQQFYHFTFGRSETLRACFSLTQDTETNGPLSLKVLVLNQACTQNHLRFFSIPLHPSPKFWFHLSPVRQALGVFKSFSGEIQSGNI